jgi:hypothetical protein
MRHPTAIVRIEIRFSPELRKTVEASNASGEFTSVGKIIHQLVATYRKVLRESPAFSGPLQELDKQVKIIVEGEVL